MKIREYSDLHLDGYASNKRWYPPPLLDDRETILILAGDLWEGLKWIKHGESSWISQVAPRFKQVLVVLGNHDYWPHGGLTITDGAAECNNLLADMGLSNVLVLDSSTWEYENTIFIGATLWTDLNEADPLTMHNMNRVMRYDGEIAYQTGPNGQWTRFIDSRWLQTHKKHKGFIERVSRENIDKTIVVITHHVPLTVLNDPRHSGTYEDGYYSSNLEDLILDNTNIKYWFYGHTHYQNRFELDECTLVNNCVGYRTENCEYFNQVDHGVIEI